jgi:hypothetical protein
MKKNKTKKKSFAETIFRFQVTKLSLVNIFFGFLSKNNE